jgi:Flp pilus assembly protein CpaB
MKNVSGLIIAIGLGVAGAALNWMYLQQESSQIEKVNFIGVRERINRGDPIREEGLVPMPYPRATAREMEEFYILWDARQTVVGRTANRPYGEGDLVLRQDLKAPPPELKLRDKNERAMWIPVDTTTFVPSLVVPGNEVSFLVSRAVAGGPTLAVPSDGEEATPPPRSQAGSTDVIGPFKVLALGNRLGSAEVMQAAKIPQLQENVITVRVKMEGDKLEPKAQKLWDLLKITNFRQVGVLLHPQDE